jgi:hypothetical protein
MKPSSFQSTDGHIFKVERDFANKQVNFMFGEEEPVTEEVAKCIKKATKSRLRPEPDYAAVTGTGTGIPVPVSRNRIWILKFRFR